MPHIHILDKSVSELIAAGEVVERPASVIKELVENSIDAGAGKVTVEIKNGGISYIRVSDDGCGISPEDIPRAFVRHATSKVQTAQDLTAIGTFGFRGEALASVAAMCKVELLSRTADHVAGTRYLIEGGEELENAETGCPVGTTILVRDLFYNTPARMKFLKKDSTEGMNVSNVVDKLALSNPNVSIRFIKDGEVKLNTPGNGDLLTTIHGVFGKEFASTLIGVEGGMGSLRVEGFISSPKGARSTRNMQNFFINSRFVRSKTCATALEEAYKLSTMVGKFPSCVLNLVIPPETVDINVHPAKIEVRFSNEKLVFDAVLSACREALSTYERETFVLTPPVKKPPLSEFELRSFDHTDRQQRLSSENYRRMTGLPPAASQSPGGTREPAPKQSAQTPITLRPPLQPLSKGGGDRPLQLSCEEVIPYQVNPPMPGGHQKVAEPACSPPQEQSDPFQFVGELFETYIVLQNSQRMVLVDKHAAHERYLYNCLKEQCGEEGERQLLLTPVSLTLTKPEYDVVLENLDTFCALGFLVEDFGEGTVIVREAPTVVPEQAIGEIVEEVAEKLQNHKRDLYPKLMEELLHSIACRGAIKAGDKSSPWELKELVKLIEERDDIHYCPHGRPVLISLTRREIEKMFGRLG